MKEVRYGHLKREHTDFIKTVNSKLWKCTEWAVEVYSQDIQKQLTCYFHLNIHLKLFLGNRTFTRSVTALYTLNLSYYMQRLQYFHWVCQNVYDRTLHAELAIFCNGWQFIANSLKINVLVQMQQNYALRRANSDLDLNFTILNAVNCQCKPTVVIFERCKL